MILYDHYDDHSKSPQCSPEKQGNLKHLSIEAEVIAPAASMLITD